MRFGFRDRDLGWFGIDERDKDKIAPGMLSVGQNTRLSKGRVDQRAGTYFPPDFNPVGGFSNYLVGSGVFNDPNGVELLLLAPANARYTYALRGGKDMFRINYAEDPNPPTAESNGAGEVQFAQSFDSVQLLRRPRQSPGQKNLVWDGTGDTDHDGIAETNWEEATLSALGTNLIDPFFNAEPFQDRLLFYNANFPRVDDRDTFIASDIGDYTSFAGSENVIRVNQAEADFITRVFGYFRQNVIVFKSHSIYQVALNPTVPLTIQMRTISASIGGYGNKIPIEAGGTVYFWSPPQGFYRITEVIEENIVQLPVAISDNLPLSMKRINVAVTAVHGCSAKLDRYVLFGVAIGVGAKACNAILVYNTQTKQWESSFDRWADESFYFNALHILDYHGASRVFAIDYKNAVVYLLYEGVNDELKSGIWSVPYKMETRGYGGSDLSIKRFYEARVRVSTFSPSFNVYSTTDGFNERTLLTPTPIEKDRNKFYTFGSEDFNALTDDPLAPKREDYSPVVLDNIAIEDYEELPDGPISTLPGTQPVMTGESQESTEPFVTRETGQWQSIAVENNIGVCAVLAVEVAGNPAGDTTRVAA